MRGTAKRLYVEQQNREYEYLKLLVSSHNRDYTLNSKKPCKRVTKKHLFCRITSKKNTSDKMWEVLFFLSVNMADKLSKTHLISVRVQHMYMVVKKNMYMVL